MRLTNINIPTSEAGSDEKGNRPRPKAKSAGCNWAKLNSAIAEALERHPEGLMWHELYNELATCSEAQVTPETFRRRLKDNRSEYALKHDGIYIVKKSL